MSVISLFFCKVLHLKKNSKIIYRDVLVPTYKILFAFMPCRINYIQLSNLKHQTGIYMCY